NGALLHRLTGAHEDARDDPGTFRLQLVLHLHRFHHGYALPAHDLLARLHLDAHDEARHGRAHGARAAAGAAPPRQLPDGTRAATPGPSPVSRFSIFIAPIPATPCPLPPCWPGSTSMRTLRPGLGARTAPGPRRVLPRPVISRIARVRSSSTSAS